MGIGRVIARLRPYFLEMRVLPRPNHVILRLKRPHSRHSLSPCLCPIPSVGEALHKLDRSCCNGLFDGLYVRCRWPAAVAAARCIGRGRVVLLRPRVPLPHPLVLSPRHLLVPRLQASSAGSDRDRGTDPSADGTLALNERNSADQLRFLGFIVSNARAADLVVDDQALALAKWAPGSVDTWTGMVRALSKTTTMYPDLSRSAALAQHIRLLAAAGR